jgi:hypothetical protein
MRRLLAPHEKEREGYVPNVVYSCGAIIHNNELVIPYAMSDINSGIATVAVDALLKWYAGGRIMKSLNCARKANRNWARHTKTGSYVCENTFGIRSAEKWPGKKEDVDTAWKRRFPRDGSREGLCL